MSAPFFNSETLYRALIRRNTRQGWSHPKKTQRPSSSSWWADTLLATDPWFQPLPDKLFVGEASRLEREVSPSPLEEMAMVAVGKPFARLSWLVMERGEEKPAGRAVGERSMRFSGGGMSVSDFLRQEKSKRKRRRRWDVPPNSASDSAARIGASGPQERESGLSGEKSGGDGGAGSAGQTADPVTTLQRPDSSPAAEGGMSNASSFDLPAEVMTLAAYINGLQRTTRGRSGMHRFPSRNVLKKDRFLKDEVSRKIGCLKLGYRGGKLRKHYGDTRLFTMEMWDYLCDESYREEGGSGVQRLKRKRGRERSDEDSAADMTDRKRVKTEEEDDPDEGMWT